QGRDHQVVTPCVVKIEKHPAQALHLEGLIGQDFLDTLRQQPAVNLGHSGSIGRDYFRKNNSTAPSIMLVKPTIRMVRSSIWAMSWARLRQRAGATNGMMPSITSTRQHALAKSSHMSLSCLSGSH